MMRFFNTAGPVNCQMHYCLPPLERLDLPDILQLIAQHKYFVLHAPRQVGKTSFLLALMEYLNQQGHYHCLYCNVEVGQYARENVAQAMQAILGEITSRAHTHLKDPFPASIWQQLLQEHGGAALNPLLTRWAEASDKPLVLLVDEIDSLVGDTLISVLRQLRAGYDKRPHAFPQSIILCGVRDVRDYRLLSDEGKAVVTGGSAFNIKATSLRLDDFNQTEVEALYRQHTEETGQVFEPDALNLTWHLTQGQPWLVNALAYEVCFELRAGRDRTQPITAAMVQEAKEAIILRRETHLDQLVDKLKEARVRRVITPIVAGDVDPSLIPTDDIFYVRDLGLIRGDARQLTISNPIYQEIIPRELTFSTQQTISQEAVWYVNKDGRLDLAKLLTAFQQFFREHSEHWVERFDYKEAGPQLLMQAFLQRIVNGGGRVEREYGLGRQRTDLLVIWPYPGGQQTAVIELKLLYRTWEQTLSDGLAQTWEYMDKTGTAEGHLIIFDRRSGRSWEERIFVRPEQHQGHPITVWGM
ncbi:MAG: ATP-binding protein [Chloroflexota bacterium]